MCLLYADRYSNIYRVCVRVCVCAQGSYSLSSSTLELLFDEMVIPSLIESRCSLSPLNGLPVIILSFFQASTSQSLSILTRRVISTREIAPLMLLRLRGRSFHFIVEGNENQRCGAVKRACAL